MRTSEDWSIEFDLLYNNISSNQAPGLTDYEKSRFLTQAQESVILDFYKGTQGDAFETTEEVTRYLSFLVKEKKLPTMYEYVNSRGINSVRIPISEVAPDIWFVTYQSARLTDGKDIIITSTTHEKLFKDLNNPFRGPSKNRMISVSDEEGIHIYSDSKNSIDYILLKYLRRPSDIIINTDTDGNLKTDDNICEAPESLHIHILLRAVQLAKAVWQM